MIFDSMDRQVIRHFYKHSGSWWSKPNVVSRYEFTKALREFCNSIKETRIFKLIKL